MFKIELSTYGIDGVRLAEKYGIQRVELCSNSKEGGTTPNLGFVKNSIPYQVDVYTIVRPRGGDFCYTQDEFETMKTDIEEFKKIGVKGIVSGVLNSDGSVDTERTSQLVELSRPMKFTFHRAFDMTQDWKKSIDDLVACEVDCILTSGQQQSALLGSDLIKNMISYADRRIEILVGSGVNSSNILQIIQKTRATNFHLSALKYVDSAMKYKNTNLSSLGSELSDEYKTMVADEQKVVLLLEELKKVEK